LLSLARGGNLHTIYGDLRLLSDEDARFQGRSQEVYRKALTFGACRMHGGVPGKSEPFGFTAGSPETGVWTVCNPAQNFQTVPLPEGWEAGKSKLLFADAGYVPEVSKTGIRLGPEQVAVLGFGSLATEKSIPGKPDAEFLVPKEIEELKVQWEEKERQRTGRFKAGKAGMYRFVFRQSRKNGTPLRISGGSRAGAKSLARLLQVEVLSDGRNIPLQINYDKIIWSGLSWAVAEAFLPAEMEGKEVEVRFTTEDPSAAILHGAVYYATRF
jgi:hypothetical protein